MQYEDFNILENTVVYHFEDGTDITIDRDLFWQDCIETERYCIQSSEDCFITYTPDEDRYNKDEYDFFADFDNVKDYVI
jgi:hypothetical protein